MPSTAIAEMQVHPSGWKCDVPTVNTRGKIWSTLIGNYKLILSKISMGIKLTLEYIERYANSVGGKLGENNYYENNEQKLNFICVSCGQTYTCDFSSFQGRRKIYCNKCSLIERGKNRKISFDEVRKTYEEKGYTLLEEDYVGCEVSMKCMDIDGYIGYIRLENVKSGYRFGTFKTTNPYYLYNLNRFCNLNDYGCNVLDWSIKNKLPHVIVKCACGEIYHTSASSLLHQKCYRCGTCSKKRSKNFLTVSRFLSQRDISYIDEKSFNDCRNILPLPFDFYIKGNNWFFLIEIDGEYHFQPITGEENLRLQKERDDIKTNYCKNNNITLLRIPYWEIDDNSFKDKILSEVNRQNQIAF